MICGPTQTETREIKMQVEQARWGLMSVEGKVKWKEETQGLMKLAENKTWWSNKIIAVALL